MSPRPRGREHQSVHLTREEGIGIIRIDRLRRFNSLDTEAARELRDCAIQATRDEGIRCVLLTGSGRAFCSGADLKFIYEQGNKVEGGPRYGPFFKEILSYLHATIQEIQRTPKPFVAGVNGVAAAGGFGLAMCCDLVYASEEAWFEWAYFRTGLSGAESTTFFLPRIVGPRKAKELMLLSPRISAREALQLGLVNGVYAQEDFQERVLKTATDLASGPTRAFGLAKQLMAQAVPGYLEEHLNQELRALVHSADTEDFRKGLKAFLDRQKPEFSGQ
ncbi:MAG: enoyl-CoA hydratase/isomerase family protein [Thermoplasmata archaeon]